MLIIVKHFLPQHSARLNTAISPRVSLTRTPLELDISFKAIGALLIIISKLNGAGLGCRFDCSEAACQSKQEGNVLQEPAAAMHLMFIWGCYGYLILIMTIYSNFDSLILIFTIYSNLEDLILIMMI